MAKNKVAKTKRSADGDELRPAKKKKQKKPEPAEEVVEEMEDSDPSDAFPEAGAYGGWSLQRHARA